jgi:hypothetical protein
MAKKKTKFALPKTVHMLKTSMFLMVLGVIALIISYATPISENCTYMSECSTFERATGYSTVVGLFALPTGMLIALMILTWLAIKSENKQSK